MDTNPITFSAILNRITTTIDGGWRVSFDIPSSDSSELLKMAKLRDVNLKICAFIEKDNSDYYELEI